MYIQDSENCIILPNDPSADKHRREKRLCRLPANLGRMEKQYAAGGGGRERQSVGGIPDEYETSSPLLFLEPAVRCTYKNAKRPTSGWLRDKLGY